MAAKLPDPTEPVPAVSQIVVLPFLAALEGYIRAEGPVSDFRITMHRTMVRGDQQYLQQLTPYVGSQQGGAGRTFHTHTGVIGASYHSGKVYRTKRYPDESTLLKDMTADQRDNGEEPSSVARSYLSVPFIGVKGRPILVLYADSMVFNRFADDELVRGVVWMSRGFAKFVTDLQRSPIGLIRNFPLLESEESIGPPTLYKRVQEKLDWLDVPSISPIASFNFESSAA